ncbi:hypothetical protein [Kitasatospora sp. NPDC002965]|uniref:hypothetical protein n=1 Tax=Kitasatospora sp. NPDC002965 TaxID=3154775 RepID=UPI0033BC0747
MSRNRRNRRRKTARTHPVIKRTSRKTPRLDPAMTTLLVQIVIAAVATVLGVDINTMGPGPM